LVAARKFSASSRELQRNLLALHPRRFWFRVGFLRDVSENDVVDADAGVESASTVEVKDFVDFVGWSLFIDVVEGAAVSDGGAFVREAEEVPHAQAVEALALRGRVFPCTLHGSVDNRFADKDPVIGDRCHGLVGVDVITLTDSVGRVLIVDEVVCGAHQVLAVREIKFHAAFAFSCT
jgi:hypothetical protein